MTNSDTTPRILIVDDDADIRSLLADYLGEQGWHVSTAQDGNTMQQVLDNTPIDLVVLDLTLPGDDGLTLCRDLRVARRWIVSWGWRWGPTTICANRLSRASCWCASATCCAAATGR